MISEQKQNINSVKQELNQKIDERLSEQKLELSQQFSEQNQKFSEQFSEQKHDINSIKQGMNEKNQKITNLKTDLGTKFLDMKNNQKQRSNELQVNIGEKIDGHREELRQILYEEVNKPEVVNEKSPEMEDVQRTTEVIRNTPGRYQVDNNKTEEDSETG